MGVISSGRYGGHCSGLDDTRAQPAGGHAPITDLRPASAHRCSPPLELLASVKEELLIL